MSYDPVVEIRGQHWLVAKRDSFGDCAILRLEGCGSDNFGQAFQIVEPFDRPRRVGRARLRRRRRDAVLRGAWASIARVRPARGLWTAAEAEIELLPYQWEPALAVLDGATRVLLADEVGLGKTVQAGLIVAELQARGLAERSVVLVPAGLRESWARELRRRFSVTTRVVDQASIAELAAAWPGVNPWTERGVTIASIDFVKRSEVLAAIDEVPIDLLIVDEAHHLTPGSDRGAGVARLAARAQWVVLISATPHSGDDRAFQYLTSLGGVGDPLQVFRRRRQDARQIAPRRRFLLAVRPTDEEISLIEGVESYARLIWKSRGATDPAVRLVACTLARRAASSATAIARTLVRRLALLSDGDDPSPAQGQLPWEDVDGADEDEEAERLARPGLDDSGDERRRLEQLISMARAAEARPSKIRCVRRLLARTREPLVLFTEYRDTLETLERALREAHAIVTLHGGLVPSLRQQGIDRFNAGGARVLIATDTGGEGLSLHHHCRLVCTMELPWNPQRLEQRVGRVDRIGQARRVHAVHLFHRGSIEDTVLGRLERRRVRAEDRLGDEVASPSENDVVAAALGDRPLIDRIAAVRLTSTSRLPDGEAHRIGEQRRAKQMLAPMRRGRGGYGGWAPPNGRWRMPTRATAVYECEWVDGEARAIGRQCVCLSIDLKRVAAGGGHWQALIATLEELQDFPANDRRENPPDDLRRFASANLFRIDRIRRSLARASAHLHQASLFDRRAALDAAVRADVRNRLDAHLAQKVARLEGWQSGRFRCRCRLISVWPAGR